MTSQSNERVVLITGSNRGIGLETAQQLAQRGWHVAIAVRSEAAAQQAANKIRDAGGKATALVMDVSDSASIRKAAEKFAAIAAHLNVLINNAGIYPDEGLNVLTVPREQMIATFQTNTFGVLEVAQAFVPYLRKAGKSRIINVSSGYGQLNGMSPGVPSYCLSKLTLNGITIMLAEALAGDGIAVNSMCPGWVRTDMGGPNATRSIPEGADTAVWLADEAPQELSGKFFRDRKEIEW